MTLPAVDHDQLNHGIDEDAARYHALAALIVDDVNDPWFSPLVTLLAAAGRGIGSIPCPQHQTAPPSDCLVIDGDQLLLARTAAAWNSIRTCVEQRLAQPTPIADDQQLAENLNRLLPNHCERDDAGSILFDNIQQRVAAALFADARIGVLTGGPGTGKTTTAAVIIALIASLNPDLQASDIAVCAPTGKAANRLRQSLSAAGQRLTLSEREAAIIAALRPATIHRTLGWTTRKAEQGGPWRHHRQQPLAQKFVLVDEASMADVELFAALTNALHDTTQLIIIGDRDQLDSVQAGGVLAELVQRGASGQLSAEQAKRLQRRLGDQQAASQWRQGLPPFNQRSNRSALPGLVAGLSYSYRAKGAPWILQLANLVRPDGGPDGRQGAAAVLAIEELFAAHQSLQLQRLSHAAQRDHYLLSQWLPLAEATTGWSLQHLPSGPLLQNALDRHQLIVATNDQVERANALGHWLFTQAAIGGVQHPEQWSLPRQPSNAGLLIHGCPLIIEAGDRSLDLTNGDMGIALGQGPGQAAQVAVFPGRDGDPLPIARLPQHRPAFAITIHKSQGSEWQSVTIDLPEHAHELLSRRLLYTAITRSSRQLALHASRSCLQRVLAS